MRFSHPLDRPSILPTKQKTRPLYFSKLTSTLIEACRKSKLLLLRWGLVDLDQCKQIFYYLVQRGHSILLSRPGLGDTVPGLNP